MATAWRMAWLAMLACVLAGPAMAQRVEGDRAAASGLYEAEVPVNNQTEAERNAGFSRAMAQVLAKITGDRAAAGKPGVGQELRRAREYVKGFDYRQDESMGTSGATRFRTMLVVRFDQDRLDATISALGLPIWPQPRPKPVLWLAIDDGKGPRLVGLQQTNAARAVLDRAVERGYRLGLPAGGAAEVAATGAIWRGDSAAIARLSSRYSPPMQLIGKLYRSGTGWKADWIFVDNGRVLKKWSTQDADARRAMAGGADGAADALIARYARRGGGAGAPGTYRILVTGVQGADEYIRLAALLDGLPVVRAVRPVSATSNGLLLDLDLLSGMPGFQRMLGDDGPLAPVEVPEGATPTFEMR